MGVQTDTALYERLIALDNLTFFGALYDMPKAEATRSATELLERFGLAERSAEKVGAYSKGMKQKVLLARALVANPDLVFFDEPTAGLDPEAAHELMTYVHDLSRERGTTFFITSHRLEEIETVCTKVGVLAGGRVVAQGSPAEVAGAIIPEVRVRVAPAPGSPLDLPALEALPDVVRVRRDDGGAVVEASTREAIPRLVRSIAAMPGDLLAVAEEPPTLEEAYLRLMSTNHTRRGGRCRVKASVIRAIATKDLARAARTARCSPRCSSCR